MKRSELTPAEILFMEVRRSGLKKQVIAERLGWSPATLSQYLNSVRRLTPEVIGRVQNVIKELHRERAGL